MWLRTVRGVKPMEWGFIQSQYNEFEFEYKSFDDLIHGILKRKYRQVDEEMSLLKNKEFY